jgi:tRNA dimethylallyltransferase
MTSEKSSRTGPASKEASFILLAGPTAVGKSEVALALAEELGGEVVSVDSMQVYRGLDIGTAKPSARDRARVRHHLIDVVDVTEPFDVSRFVELAGLAVGEIRGRGRTPIFCGGTGLYFKAFLSGLGQSPASEPGLRAQLEATPSSELLRELAERDPETFARIDRHNRRRVLRAVEVIRLTGSPYSALRAEWKSPSDTVSGVVAIGFSRSAEDLRARIDQRVDKMFNEGLVAETEGLLKRGLRENRIALQALGYRQAVDYLDGKTSLSDTVALVKRRTRHYAKRQMTWFRKQLDLRWFSLEPGQSIGSLVEKLVDFTAPKG